MSAKRYLTCGELYATLPLNIVAQHEVVLAADYDGLAAELAICEANRKCSHEVFREREARIAALAEDYRKLGVLYSGTSQVCEQRGIRIAALEATLAELKEGGAPCITVMDPAAKFLPCTHMQEAMNRIAALEAALQEIAMYGDPDIPYGDTWQRYFEQVRETASKALGSSVETVSKPTKCSRGQENCIYGDSAHAVCMGFGTTLG